MKQRLFKDLSEEERELFTAKFYDLWEETFPFAPDFDSPHPWGCPWYFGWDEEASTPEEFLKKYKSVIEKENKHAKKKMDH